MPQSSPTSLLVDLPESVLWSSRSWHDFAKLPSPKDHLAVLPVFGFADWGLGRPLNLEEILGCGVLRAMLSADAGRTRHLSILPPLRFVLGPYPNSCFAIDLETALGLVREIALGVAAAGLRRLVFLNTSPWNEDFLKTCACDLRVDFGMQTFLIQLDALGLDLHPTRSSTRAAAQAAACALTRRSPAGDSPRADIRFMDFRPGDLRQPPPLAWSRSLDASVTEGWTVLAEAGSRLGQLLDAIEAHPPLPLDGALPPARPSPPRKRSATKRPPARRRRSR